MILGIQSTLYAQTCSTSSGIDLSKNNGPFSTLPARDQGQLGTCYAHSGSDLISSYLKIGRINIYQTAVANDTSMSGGSPGDVIDSFARLGSACTNTSLFRNLFPSVNTNIISELQDTFVGTPIFYTIHAFEAKGITRQKRIAEKASAMALNQVASGIVSEYESALTRYHAFNKEISSLQVKIRKLEDKKSWFSSNTEIEKQINKIKQQITVIEKKAKAEHAKYVAGLGRLNQSNNLDALNEDEAADVVYYNIKKQHLIFSAIMKKYGLQSMSPTLAEFIIDRVHYDPNHKYSYAGIMYPYKLIKQAMEKACPSYEKAKIPSNLKGASMRPKTHSRNAIQDKIEALLERNRQAVSVSFPSSILTGGKGELHAVNIIGCRTNGHNTEYLLQNSWGQNCSGYKSSLQGKCSQGRVWVPSNSLVNNLTEINWISR